MRRAVVADAPEVARLLHDFHTEFSEPTPGIEVLTGRARRLLADGEMAVMLGGERPDGLALSRVRPSIWTGALDGYLEELYVAPQQRGQGIGRALVEEAMEDPSRGGRRSHGPRDTRDERRTYYAYLAQCPGQRPPGSETTR